MQDLTGIIVLWGVRVFLIIVLTPIIVLAASHMVGIEKASFLRAVAVAIFGLLLLVLLVLPTAATLAKSFGTPLPIAVPAFLNLPVPQLIAIYLVSWIALIKVTFESTFLDAFAVGMSSAVILLITATIVLFLTSIIFIP